MSLHSMLAPSLIPGIRKWSIRISFHKGSTASQRSPDTKIKLGEVLVKAVRDCGELVPRYSQLLLSSLLSGVHDTDELVRASSLSNIGEVCKLLRFSIGPIVNEVRLHHVPRLYPPPHYIVVGSRDIRSHDQLLQVRSWVLKALSI